MKINIRHAIRGAALGVIAGIAAEGWQAAALLVALIAACIATDEIAEASR